MISYLKRMALPAFAVAITLLACTESKTTKEEQVEISKMDSTSETVKHATEKLDNQTQKVEESLEKLDKQETAK
jgi:septal ring factor EnvC (AmiA/AmiB activator)